MKLRELHKAVGAALKPQGFITAPGNSGIYAKPLQQGVSLFLSLPGTESWLTALSGYILSDLNTFAAQYLGDAGHSWDTRFGPPVMLQAWEQVVRLDPVPWGPQASIDRGMTPLDEDVVPVLIDAALEVTRARADPRLTEDYLMTTFTAEHEPHINSDIDRLYLPAWFARGKKVGEFERSVARYLTAVEATPLNAADKTKFKEILQPYYAGLRSSF